MSAPDSPASMASLVSSSTTDEDTLNVRRTLAAYRAPPIADPVADDGFTASIGTQTADDSGSSHASTASAGSLSNACVNIHIYSADLFSV